MWAIETIWGKKPEEQKQQQLLLDLNTPLFHTCLVGELLERIFRSSEFCTFAPGTLLQ